MRTHKMPVCTECGKPVPNIPSYFEGLKVEVRCKACVTRRYPDAYRHVSSEIYTPRLFSGPTPILND